MIDTVLQPSLHDEREWVDILVATLEGYAETPTQREVAAKMRAELDDMLTPERVESTDDDVIIMDEMILQVEETLADWGYYVYTDNDSFMVSDQPVKELEEYDG